jgi:hypothetical protein
MTEQLRKINRLYDEYVKAYELLKAHKQEEKGVFAEMVSFGDFDKKFCEFQNALSNWMIEYNIPYKSIVKKYPLIDVIVEKDRFCITFPPFN